MKPESEENVYGLPIKIATNKIRTNCLQPPRHFDPAGLEELATSFMKHGWTKPICVSFDAASGFYEIIAGERRWRAAQLAGLHEIEVVVRQTPPAK